MAASNVATTSKRPAWAKELSEKEFAWTISYLQHFNKKLASQSVGHAVRGSHTRGYEYGQRPQIREAIAAALKERMPAIKMSIAERLAAIVSTDITQVAAWGQKKIQINQGAVDAGGRPQKPRYQTVWDMEVKPSKSLTPAERAAIKTVKKRPTLYGTGIEVTLHDPVIAAERLAALLGLIETKEGGGAGNVTFVIELPDGTTMTDLGKAPVVIDNDEMLDHVRSRKTAATDEVPPGTRLVIEAP